MGYINDVNKANDALLKIKPSLDRYKKDLKKKKALLDKAAKEREFLEKKKKNLEDPDKEKEDEEEDPEEKKKKKKEKMDKEALEKEKEDEEEDPEEKEEEEEDPKKKKKKKKTDALGRDAYKKAVVQSFAQLNDSLTDLGKLIKSKEKPLLDAIINLKNLLAESIQNQ